MGKMNTSQSGGPIHPHIDINALIAWCRILSEGNNSRGPYFLIRLPSSFDSSFSALLMTAVRDNNPTFAIRDRHIKAQQMTLSSLSTNPISIQGSTNSSVAARPMH